MLISARIDMAECDIHTGETLDTVDGLSILDCKKCEFTHVMPLPNDDRLQEFYKKEFYDTEKPDYFKYAEEDMEWWMATYDRYFDLLETHTKGRRILDIGSGPGYFLDAGVKRGWEVLGFEPSFVAAHYAAKRGHIVVNDIFSSDKASQYGLFDAIMISLVLEHVPDPARFIEEAKQALVPGGLLCVIVPNDYNSLQRLLVEHNGFKPWWVVPTHHLNYFTVESLVKFLTSRGLAQLHVETSYPMEMFLLSGRNYVGNPDIGRACHKERKAMEMTFFSGDKPLLQRMYTAWAKEGIGREVVVIFRTKN